MSEMNSSQKTVRAAHTASVRPMTPEIAEQRVRLGARLLQAAQERLEAREAWHQETSSAVESLRAEVDRAEKRASVYEQQLAQVEKQLELERHSQEQEREAFKQALGILSEQLAGAERNIQKLTRRLDLQDRHLAEMNGALLRLDSEPARHVSRAAAEPEATVPVAVLEATTRPAEPLIQPRQNDDEEDLAMVGQNRPVYRELLAQLRQQPSAPAPASEDDYTRQAG